MNKCAITGMGILTSIGHDISEFEASLISGKVGICDFNETEKEFRYPFAKIKGFSLEEYKKRYASENQKALVDRVFKVARRYSEPYQMDIMVALAAYIQANVDSDVLNESKAVIVAGSNLNCREQFEQYRKYIVNDDMVLPSYAMNFFDTSLVGILSELFGCLGEGFSIGGASASGNVALIKGMQMIHRGEADLCLVLGSVEDFSTVEIEGFMNLGALCTAVEEPQKSCRPFDEKHSGFVLGQTAACMILENKDKAEKRGAEVLAELAAGCIRLHGSRLTEANEDCEYRTMKKALENAGMTAKDIAYINAHATSTPMGDEVETNAVRRLLRETERDRECLVNSTKGLIGHGIYSAGVAEAIASVIQMRGGFVHPNANLEGRKDENFRLIGDCVENTQIDACMSNSFGFGGINSTIILKRSGN